MPLGLVWLGKEEMLLPAAYLLGWKPSDGPAGLAVLALGKKQVFTGNYPKPAQTQLERFPLM